MPGRFPYFLQLSFEPPTPKSRTTSKSLSLSSPFLSLPGVKVNLTGLFLPMGAPSPVKVAASALVSRRAP